MLWRLSADFVLVVHLAFVLFVLLGGLLVLRWPRLLWLHLAAIFWGALIEFAGFTCPLTPLEVALRELGGEAGYQGGFIEHYLTAALYPEGLTREIQIVLGAGMLLLNATIYGYVLVRRKRLRAQEGE